MQDQRPARSTGEQQDLPRSKRELPRLCTLRDQAAFTAFTAFTACAADGSAPQCRDIACWFSECKQVPPTCP